jgi:phage/plasmid-associated DNA primase
LEECCEVATAHDAPARKLYEPYKQWAEDMNEYVLKERKFAEGMQEHGRKSRQKAVAGKQNRVYEGLRIRDKFESIGARTMEEIPEDVI